MAIRLISLYSGSTGNAFVLKTEDTTILIDAGRHCKNLTHALEEVGIAPEEISAIFITHEHCDHTSALPVFMKKIKAPIHILDKCSQKLVTEPELYAKLTPHEDNYREYINSIEIVAFSLSHDSLDCTGYRFNIPTESGMVSVGYATDLGYVSGQVEKALKGCSAVVLESNHDVEMLKDGSYPYDLKKRILSRHGHLSNEDASDFGVELYKSGTKKFLLAHLSQENNDPAIAYDLWQSKLPFSDVEIQVAQPDNSVEITL